jgi:F0F1-type ATP synthase epsilon subunit
MFFVEGTLRWQNYVVYSGVIEIGGNVVTVTADAEYFFEDSSDNPALNEDSPECVMIIEVVAVFEPNQS